MDEAGHFIAKKDWPDFALLMAEFRAVGKTLRRPQAGELRPGRGQPFYIGKPTSNLSTGVLSGKQVQPYLGPAHSPDATVGSPRDVHFSTGDFTTSDYVVVTRYRGKWYVSCLPTS
jgi:hypothetical protein